MKEIRTEFTVEEYDRLQAEANRLHIPLKQLIHDRAVGTDPSRDPLAATQVLAEEISKNRDVLNQIIQRETTAEIRLYEDDVIRLELAMTELESIVASFIGKVLKEVG